MVPSHVDNKVAEKWSGAGTGIRSVTIQRQARSIELHVKIGKKKITIQKAKNDAHTLPPSPSTLLVIVFEADDENVNADENAKTLLDLRVLSEEPLKAPIVKGLDGGEGLEVEVKFKFKNAVVLLELPQPDQPASSESIAKPEVFSFEDNADSVMSPAPIVRSDTSIGSRPSTAATTARVLIVLEPPPAPVDYNKHACSIQVTSVCLFNKFFMKFELIRFCSLSFIYLLL